MAPGSNYCLPRLTKLYNSLKGVRSTPHFFRIGIPFDSKVTSQPSELLYFLLFLRRFDFNLLIAQATDAHIMIDHSRGTMVQAAVMSTLLMDSRFNKQLHPIVKRHP